MNKYFDNNTNFSVIFSMILWFASSLVFLRYSIDNVGFDIGLIIWILLIGSGLYTCFMWGRFETLKEWKKGELK